MIKTITRKWLESHSACSDQVKKFSVLFPKGMSLTRENIQACQGADLDVIWAACHLMSKAQRRGFIIFTLRQRQPHLVNLFTHVGLNSHAEQIRVLTFNDMDEVISVFNAVRAAATAAAWDVATAAATAAAWDAARDAAWVAATDAVRDAARDAAWDAARDAAWDAARDDARDDARDAARTEQVNYCISILLLKEGESVPTRYEN